MQPSLFLSHGGGPLPLLKDPSHFEMIDVFDQIKNKLQRPDAIIIISAHWEASHFYVSTNPAPAMLYDYSGFPPESYQITYPAPGSLEVAQKIIESLDAKNIASFAENHRGYDHGTFVPLKLLFPEANIPVIPISLRSNLDPQQHIDLGECLAEFRKQNILVIGSGMQFHNLQLIFNSSALISQQSSMEFTQWLDETLTSTNLSEGERQQRLVNWKNAPSALISHPREEHLLPLHVCYGAAKKPVTQVFSLKIFNIITRCYWWD